MNIEYENVQEYIHALLSVDKMKAAAILERYYSCEQDFNTIELLIRLSLESIGKGWEDGSTSLSQVYMAGVICEELLEQYLPKSNIQRKSIPRLAIAVLLDHHGLGKKIVMSIIRAQGYEIMDFGHGLSVEELVELSLSHSIDVLLISTLMLPSALKVKEVKERLRKIGSSTHVVVGGAPFRLDPNLWLRVGTDADGGNATEIIETIQRLVMDK